MRDILILQIYYWTVEVCIHMNPNKKSLKKWWLRGFILMFGLLMVVSWNVAFLTNSKTLWICVNEQGFHISNGLTHTCSHSLQLAILKFLCLSCLCSLVALLT